MKKEEVEIYADTSDFAVMRHPGRKFPGSLIQGDSLKILISDLKEAQEELGSGNYEEVMDILSDIEERLQDRLDVYLKAIDGYDFE